MRYGSICSGIEAATVAWRPLGWRCAFVSEVEPFASEVLKHRLPEVRNIGECTKIRVTGNGERETGKEVADYDGDIDLLVGGTPCQSFSTGGKRGGIADPRGNLAIEFVRLAERTDAKWLVWENVPAVLAINGGRDFAAFLSELVGWDVEVPGGGWGNAGIVTNAPGRFGVSWRVLDARYTRVSAFPWAVPQRRRRVILVGCRDRWQSAAEALLGGELCGGDACPRRAARVCASRDAGTSASRVCFPIDMMNIEGRTKNLKTKCYDEAGTAMYTLRSSHVNAVCTPCQLRRLLPVESERLMGFPDGWTDIPWKDKAHPPDGLRHRVCGNSMCVNVMRWIGERIDAVAKGKEFQDYGREIARRGDGAPSHIPEGGGG